MISMTRLITLQDTVVAAKGQVSADIGGELVLLNMASGEYFGLNAVGSRVWELIAEPVTVSDIRDHLLREYADVDAERCTMDLLALLNDMHEASLIDTADAPRS